MLDSNCFRPNVGIILCNGEGKLFWAKRIGQDAWQFPQGGIKRTETPEQALFRELNEEVGLGRDDVEILHETSDWLRYRLPQNFIRQHNGPVCIGQKQKWFLLALQSDDNSVHLDRTCEPEFDDWCWVNYWHPVNQVINFKRDVYRKALTELESALNSYVKSR